MRPALITRFVDIAIVAGLLLAGWQLRRLGRVGRGLRFLEIATTALTLVAACSFLIAAWSGTPAPRTPSAVPGAVGHVAVLGLFAALVVLPLGWVISVLRLGIPKFREGAVAPAAIRFAALTACAGLLVAQFQQTRNVEHPRTPEQRAAMLQNSLRAIADGDRDMPRDRWDPDYVVAFVGRDPQRLFRWVQQNTYWIPYHGVLRGAVGVLLDRQGNSLDRALLLATLLERSAFTVRLAHGELSRDEAIPMLPSLVAERAVDLDERPLKVQPLPGLRDAALQYHLDPDGVQRTVADQELGADKIAAQLEARVERQTKYLLSTIQRPEKDADWNRRFESGVAALQDHWWVQVQDGFRWADLDLLVGDGARSVALATPNETFPMASLGADLYHQIVVRVVAEQWQAGGTKEHNSLEYTLRPADLIGEPIVLQFVPTDWLSDSGAVVQGMADIRATTLQFKEWAAGLAVGGKTVASAVLRDTGDESASPKGGLFALGAALDSTMKKGRNVAAPTHFLSAVWIEYEIRVPGEKARRIRRNVFDLIGPAARATGVSQLELDDEKKLRRSLALGMKTEILPQVCQFAPEFVAHLTSAPLVANQKLLAATVDPEFSPDNDETKHLLAEATPPASPLLGLAYLRFEWNHARRHVFMDRPNILSRHQYLAPIPKGIAYSDAIDIVNNEVGVSLAAPDAFEVRLQQGVRDTNNEALLFGGGGSGNAADAYADSHDWITISPANQDVLNRLNLSADTRSRIAQDTAANYLVVTPATPLDRAKRETVAWWRIDADTGTALGMGQNGWGQELAEEARISAVLEVGKAFLWETGLCHTFAQVLNFQIYVKELLVGDWHPSWTGPGNVSKDPIAVVNENKRLCLIQAMISGFVATLPLLMMSMKFSRVTRELEMEEAEEFAKRRPPPREPCVAYSQEPFSPSQQLASFSIAPVFATLFSGTMPCVPPHGKGPPAPRPGKTGPRGEPPRTPKDDPCAVNETNSTEPRPTGTSAAAQALEDLKLAKQQELEAYEALQKAKAEAYEAGSKMLQYRQNLPKPVIDPQTGKTIYPPPDPAKFDPAVYQRLVDEDERAFAMYEQRVEAYENAQMDVRFKQVQANRAAGRSGLACGWGNPDKTLPDNDVPPNGDPGGSLTTDNSGQNGATRNTQQGLGHNLTDQNGPDTIRDTITKVPVDSNEPFKDTMRDPSVTQRSPQPQPSSEPPLSESVPPTERGGPPTKNYPPNSSNGPVTQRSPQPTPSPGTPTLVGIGGTLDAFGGPK